jgi:2-dehydropantoate 2-reductase
VEADTIDVAALEDYGKGNHFDLILLATKAQDALEVAPHVAGLLAPEGVILPIQNGAVARLLADRLGDDKIVGGFSNLGATMVEPGVYEQKNAGHLLIGELAGGVSERVERIARALGRAIEVKISSNLTGAIWSKLLINCSVTTLGALCSQTMRQYMETEAGKKVFRRTYEEALSVALAIGTRLERLTVDPIPPGWSSSSGAGEDYDSWVKAVIDFYGDIKPSMLQDFERGQKTEVDFINGYVVALGHASGVPVHINATITDLVHQIERGVLQPTRERMNELADQIGD